MKLKKVCVALGILALSAPASAIVFNDVLNTIQNTINNLQDIEHRIYEEIERQANRMLEKELSAAGIESEAQMAAQEQLAEQRAAQNLRNHEIARQQAPLVDVCRDSALISITSSTSSACYKDNKSQDIKAVFENRRILPDESLSEQEDKVIVDAKMTLEQCSTDYLREDAIGENGEVDISKSFCFDATALLDSTVSTLPSGAQEDAAEVAIKVITEPTVRQRRKGWDDVATASGRKVYLREKRKDMLLDLAQSVMVHNLELRRSSQWVDAERTIPIPSTLETLEEFNKNRLLSTGGEYLLKLGAAHKDKFSADEQVAIESTFNIEQVQRETAVMTAFLSHMAVLQYKSQLRMEQMEAAILSLKVNPL